MRNRGWALTDWLYWLEPSQREWFWWDASVRGADSLLVRVQVTGWPTALGSLEWVLLASGAREVTVS